jgi:Sec-independent protein translocase protein TatA
MEFLGVGPMELFFIIILALIILGPRDMQKAGKTLGRWMNKMVKSDTWKLVRQASNKIKYLPNELMREAGLEDIKNAGQELSKAVNKDFTQVNNDLSQSMEDPFKAWREQNPGAVSKLDDAKNQENRIELLNKIDRTGE